MFLDNQDKREQSLVNHAATTWAVVYKFPGDNVNIGESVAADFVYTVNEKKYIHRDLDATRELKDKKISYRGRVFPVVYDSTNAEYCHILIKPADFEKYGVPLPGRFN